MNKLSPIFLAGFLVAQASLRSSTPPPAGPVEAAEATTAADQASRADRRYQEMLDRMRAAVEEVAALYGNPSFLQVFTNEPSRAEELKQRLRTDRSAARLAAETKDLEKQREDLRSDIALKEREAARLTGRLVRERAALDALAAAVAAARQAVEDTSR